MRVPGTRGIMLCFDDFLPAIEKFGERVLPLMRSRVAAELDA